MSTTDQLCVNTLRFLAVDAVEEAKSGHPGLPLGAAPMTYVLWDRFLHHNPKDPNWMNRDRFILSAGHGSALLYALLHVTGYGLTVEDLKGFRQYHSLTPGHPEHGLTKGVEATTGPLGQGFAMGVGMAAAERYLAATFNKPQFPVVDHYTYALVSDGDLMEGVASEAASLAGTLGLGKLIYLYDDNHISIEGSTDLAFTENVRLRFQSYGWQVLTVPDGNDLNLIEVAIRLAQEEKNRPSIIAVRTQIGYGSPKQGTKEAHGEPLGTEAAEATRQALSWTADTRFYVPEEAAVHFAQTEKRGLELQRQWQDLWDNYRNQYPELADSLQKMLLGDLPDGWIGKLPVFAVSGGAVATRDASGKVMNVLAGDLPQLIGGSADLAPSTKTFLNGEGEFSATSPEGRNFHFGVREHAMGAVLNGMALHGGVIPYGSTFLTFADYMRPSMRLAAIMNTHVVFVFTHDSLAVGEDGPTHQPVEHLMSLRSIPGLTVIRPADANETTIAWRMAIERKSPTALILTRQKIGVLDPQNTVGAARGAYIIKESSHKVPQLMIVATGSEVELALKASTELISNGIDSRVVSMPSWEIFDEQSPEYRLEVWPLSVPVVIVEAGITTGWQKYCGTKYRIIGIDHFGTSAPGPVAMDKLGFNVANVVEKAMELVE